MSKECYQLSTKINFDGNKPESLTRKAEEKKLRVMKGELSHHNYSLRTGNMTTYSAQG
jgi:hypothetical protein